MNGYGKSIGPSPIVAGGEVVQIGSRPGQLDAHVRPNMLILRCEPGHGAGCVEGGVEFVFNDEDAEILERVAAIAARKSPPYWLLQIDLHMEREDGEDLRDERGEGGVR